MIRNKKANLDYLVILETMELHHLPFGKIIILREDIAEVIIDEGIEFSTEMVDQYHKFLLSHLKAPFLLLINKINTYTYDFEAQQKLASLEEIKKMAVVSYSQVTHVTTEYLAAIPREVTWNLKIFPDRELALTWLKSTE